ncbi:MAG: hypothetical protein ACYCOU_02900 [Sulfobacillus sp.]
MRVLMDAFYRVKVGVPRCGFANQLGFVISAAVKCMYERRRFLLAEPFLIDFEGNHTCSLGEVVDLDQLNAFLRKYGLTILDRRQANIELIAATYGSHRTFVDVTDRLRRAKEDRLFEPAAPSQKMNDIFGDPSPHMPKTLFVRCSVSGQSLLLKFREEDFRELPQLFDLSLLPVDHDICWVSSYDESTYDEILRQVRIAHGIRSIAEVQRASLISDQRPFEGGLSRVNVLHLRDEPDAIEFWSRINGVLARDFAERLRNKYFELVEKHCSRDERLLVLSANDESPLLKRLSQSGFKYFVSEKRFPSQRELNAAVDLCLAEGVGNGIFIGGIIGSARGSSYSYFLSKRLRVRKQVLFDLDDIEREPIVCIAQD